MFEIDLQDAGIFFSKSLKILTRCTKHNYQPHNITLAIGKIVRSFVIEDVIGHLHTQHKSATD